jgi:hypothetical protein
MAVRVSVEVSLDSGSFSGFRMTRLSSTLPAVTE